MLWIEIAVAVVMAVVVTLLILAPRPVDVDDLGAVSDHGLRSIAAMPERLGLERDVL